MKRIPRFLALLFWVSVFSLQVCYADNVSLEAAFSPRQGATELVVKTINEAQESVRLAGYSFTSRRVAASLVAAMRRGIDVKVVLDKSQDNNRSLAGLLKENNVPVRINRRYSIMHNKFIVVDNKALELGSFNYSRAAEERNAENVLVIRGAPSIVADYARQWDKLWGEAE